MGKIALNVKLRIEGLRDKLREMGFRSLSVGPFGLPSYDQIEAWANGATVVYLVVDLSSGGWDILHSIDSTNDAEKTWKALDALLGD